ncbi:hypothetical protein ACHAW5_000856 [Stephanodiscus triporus]|uniref:Sulfotransferase n=1 Tax=Stephanodiscus triporus TaxID=2934178 RepID=A0ABD3PUM0_9STRA
MSRSLNSLIIVKGCFVFAVFLMVTSCYMYSLARALTSSSYAAVGLEVNSCVRKVEQQCKLYPCKERNGVMEEITPSSRFFGYAGNFVRRQGNITKPHQLFSLGDTGWASGCILSDEYKFVFIHVLKSGGKVDRFLSSVQIRSLLSFVVNAIRFIPGTAVKKFIRDSLCGIDDDECEHVPTTLVRAEGCIKSIRDHQDYFHFSFVRNPFSRMYSAYSMMDGFPPKNGIRGRLPTKDLSFSNFVLKPYQRGLHTSMWPGHYDRQETFLFSEDKCPVFDFLGRIEHFDEDIRRVLNHLNATKMIEYLESMGGKVTPANSWGSDKKKIVGGLRKEYSTPQIVSRVASEYMSDFQLLGYDSHDIPEK